MAASAALRALQTTAKYTTPKRDKAAPNTSACTGAMRPAGSGRLLVRRRNRRILDRGRFHARTDWLRGALSACAVPIANCKRRRQIALILTPKDSMTAPSATCAVATSAALLLQMTQPPRAI